MTINLNLKRFGFLCFFTIYLYDFLSYLISDKSVMYNLITFSVLIIYIMLFYTQQIAKVVLKKDNLFFLLFLFMIFLSGITSGNIISVLLRILSFLFIFFPIVLFDFIYEAFDKKLIKNIFWIYTTVLVILCFKTIAVLQQYPTLARTMTSGLANNNQIMSGMRIGGGFFLVYPLLLFIINFMTFKKNNTSKLFIFIIPLFIYTIFVSQFTIALVLLVLSIVLILLKKLNIKSILIILCTLFFLVSNSTNIQKFINNSTYAVKFAELTTKTSSSTNIDGRTSRIDRSINTFIENPLIGVSYKTGYNYNVETDFVGSHSDFVDTFARYGLFSTLVLYYALYKKFKKYNFSLLFVLLFVLIGILNPVFNATNFLMVFLYINIYNYIFSNTNYKGGMVG